MAVALPSSFLQNRGKPEVHYYYIGDGPEGHQSGVSQYKQYQVRIKNRVFETLQHLLEPF
jgi:hypothetical protein